MLALVAVVVVLVAVQVARVHHSTGELRLMPSSAPPKLQEFGRHYRRTGTTTAPRDARQVGATSGGGDVLVPHKIALNGPPTDLVVPPVIWVRDDHGQVWSYALVGGP